MMTTFPHIPRHSIHFAQYNAQQLNQLRQEARQTIQIAQKNEPRFQPLFNRRGWSMLNLPISLTLLPDKLAEEKRNHLALIGQLLNTFTLTSQDTGDALDQYRIMFHAVEEAAYKQAALGTAYKMGIHTWGTPTLDQVALVQYERHVLVFGPNVAIEGFRRVDKADRLPCTLKTTPTSFKPTDPLLKRIQACLEDPAQYTRYFYKLSDKPGEEGQNVWGEANISYTEQPNKVEKSYPDYRKSFSVVG